MRNFEGSAGCVCWSGSANIRYISVGVTERARLYMNAIDTNVLFYSLDADEAVKQPQAVALLGQLTASNGTVVPWQVACEFLGLLRA